MSIPDKDTDSVTIPEKDETPEFGVFCESVNEENVIVSRDMITENPFKIRVIGPAVYSNDSDLQGITIHSTGKWVDFDVERHIGDLQTVMEIADRAEIPVVWIGEPTTQQKQQSLDYKDLTFETTALMRDGDGIMTSRKTTGNMKTILTQIEEYMEVTFKSVAKDVSKDINVKATDLFHEAVRNSLGYSVIDADMIGQTAPGSPVSIVEIKRSKYVDLDEWFPFKDDYSSFRVQFALADATDLTPMVVTQDKPVPEINANDKVYVFDMSYDIENRLYHGNTHEKITYARTETTAMEAFKHTIEQSKLPAKFESDSDPSHGNEPAPSSHAPSDD